MALATRCPHCNTTFRVASDQLKLRGGIVRCGTCNQVFDGNASLVDLDLVEPKKTPPPSPAAPAPAAPPVPAPEPAPEPAPAPEPQIAPAPSASDLFDSQIAAIESGSPIVMPAGYVLDFDLSDPVWHLEDEPPTPQPEPRTDDYAEPPTQFSPDDDLAFEQLNDAEFDPPVPEEGELSLADEIDSGFSSEAPPEAAPEAAHHQVPEVPEVPDADIALGPLPLLRAAANEAAPEPVALSAPAEPEHEEPEFVRLAREKEQAAWRRRLTMGIGSLLLALALAAQGVTTFRNVLAAKYPALKPALAAACVPLQCKVELPAQIENLVIETGELQTLNPTTFVLTTLLRNESGLTQAWPHIELELKDANDKVVVRRVFTPPQYLPAGAAAKGFAGHAEQPVKIHFELNQLKASGFNIAVFYP
jgi:predicted Zn finger-like uncharacterized protein